MDINATMEAMRAARGTPMPPDEVVRAITTGTGLVGYDLEAPAKTLYVWGEQLTPLRNRMPRVKGNGGTATNWKAVTGINTANTHPGVSEGNRGAVVSTTVTPYTAAYVSLGLEDNVTFEADESAQGFDDAKARATIGLLRSLMLAEEKQLLCGNSLVAMGTTPTPTVVGAETGGAIAAGTYSVICVALTADGYKRASVGAAGVVQSISKTNADGTTDTIKGFAAQQSAAASTGALAGVGVNKISASVAAVRGAFGYAWFVGTAGAEKIAAITRINSMVVTALPAAGNQAASALTAADWSKDETFNLGGLYYQALLSTSGAYFKALATGTAGTGSKLTSDGKGGVQEINDAINSIWDAWAFEPDEILVHRQDAEDISKLILSATTGPLFRLDITQQAQIAAGGRITTYISPVTGKVIPIKIHRDAIQGTILLNTWDLPMKLSGVDNIVQVKLLKDYYQIEWPLRTRKYEYGVYAREVVQHYAPFALGIITNVAQQ